MGTFFDIFNENKIMEIIHSAIERRNFGGDFGYLVVPWSHAKGYLEEFLLSPNFTTILSGAQPQQPAP